MNSRIPGTLISQGLDRARPEMTLKRKRRNEKGGGGYVWLYEKAKIKLTDNKYGDASE